MGLGKTVQMIALFLANRRPAHLPLWYPNSRLSDLLTSVFVCAAATRSSWSLTESSTQPLDR